MCNFIFNFETDHSTGPGKAKVCSFFLNSYYFLYLYVKCFSTLFCATKDIIIFLEKKNPSRFRCVHFVRLSATFQAPILIVIHRETRVGHG